MIKKKTEQADLEGYRGLFIKVGYIVALGAILLAFEWTTSAEKASSLGTTADMQAEEEIVPITRQDVKPPPPPPPQEQVADVLNLADDDAELEEEADAMSSEADENTMIEIQELPSNEVEEEEVFFVVEEMPLFPGGERGLKKWIAQKVKYPAIARENDIQGKVFVRFVVTSSGKVDKVQIIRGVDPLLDAESVRVVKSLPRWKPGMQRGKPVSVWYTVPINFKLQ
ncbi:MAG: TonB family protein [Bacteroidales bacterium]|nr:TonB family protein [Bacteroidales bacterium]